MESGKLTGRVVLRSALDGATTEQLWALFAACYDQVSRERFLADLAEKQWVVLLEDREGGTVAGFSTQCLLHLDHEGVRHHAVFSGDTIIDPRFWGEQELVRTFCRLLGSVKSLAPTEPLWWLLISKGFRTYMFLPLYCRTYHPHVDRPTPPLLAQLVNLFASSRFGDAYDPAAGLLRFVEPHGQLRPDLADVPGHRTDDRNVNFFLSRNPRYRDGDELVCLSELSSANLRGTARRCFDAGLATPLDVVTRGA